VSGEVLVLRPEPGASATAARARALGLRVTVAPLFTVRPLDWAPPRDAEAILLTSAHAARLAGPGLARLLGATCYAVGEATAAAARQAGFTDLRVGPGDGAAAVAMAKDDGVRRLLHLCGREHVPFAGVERRIVYAADALDSLPEAAARALARGALALLHSPRAAARLAELVPDRGHIRLAAISAAAAQAAGGGWAGKALAAAPRDEALLELAARLCQTAPPRDTKADDADGL
jgi:uroporphyrinogen-III synthase